MKSPLLYACWKTQRDFAEAGPDSKLCINTRSRTRGSMKVSREPQWLGCFCLQSEVSTQNYNLGSGIDGHFSSSTENSKETCRGALWIM